MIDLYRLKTVTTIIPIEMAEINNGHKRSNMEEHLEKIVNYLDYVTWGLVALSVFFGGVLLRYKSKLSIAQKLQIKTIEESTAKANERAAEAEKQAAEANQKAEEERLARVKIEKQLAPRTLSEVDREEISKELLSFASNFSGRKIKISSYSHDAEGIVFAIMIDDIIKRAGIETEHGIGRSIPVGLVNIGVKITGPIKDRDFINAFSNGIYSRLKTGLLGEWKDEYKELNIFVGVKPVEGLPDIIVTNK